MNALESKIKQAAVAYYNGEAIMSDAEFDALVEQLRAEKPDSEVLTIGWGDKAESGSHLKKYKHSFTVGSLSKRKHESMAAWAESTDTEAVDCVSSKLDGISAVVYYDDKGRLKYVLTRNDGQYGYDVTANLPKANIPKQLSEELAGKLSWVRGELVIRKDRLAEGYANVRNMVAGLANTAKPNELNELIEFVAYETDIAGDAVERKQALTADFDVVRFIAGAVLDRTSGDSLFNYYKPEYAYAFLTDGVVIQNADGSSYAVKFPTQVYECEVLDVEINASDKGRLIPVIRIQPTEMSGSVISLCSGFNFKAILENNIGKGSIIQVTKANEVIPDWCGTIKSTEAIIPTTWNGKPTKWDGVHLTYELDREAVMVKALMTAVAPFGFAEAKIDAMIEHFQLTTLQALKNLVDSDSRNLEAVLTPAFIQRGNELLDNLKTITLPTFLQAMNLNGVGETTTAIINAYYAEVGQDFFTSLKELGRLPKELEAELPTYVPAKSIEENFDFIKSAFETGFNVVLAEVAKKEEAEISVTLTGKLSKPRNQLLADWGSKVAEVAINKAHYLVTDDKDAQSSKAVKARKLGVKIVTEAEFNEILKG
mgnify:CR=1 FL=1|jgi:DNA ligase (NAD+)